MNTASVGVILSLTSRHGGYTLRLSICCFLLASTRAISIFRYFIRGDEGLTCMQFGALLKLGHIIRANRIPHTDFRKQKLTLVEFAPYIGSNAIIHLRKYYSYLRGVVTFRPRVVLQYRFTMFESRPFRRNPRTNNIQKSFFIFFWHMRKILLVLAQECAIRSHWSTPLEVSWVHETVHATCTRVWI